MYANIKDFLTPKSEKYYTEVLNIVRELEEKSKINDKNTYISIYGGFIRNIILHYFEYQQNNEVNFTPSKDVDIWFHHNKNTWISFNTFLRRMNTIIDSMKEFNFVCDKQNIVDKNIINYRIQKYIINDIHFDVCSNINNFSTFDTLSDFSVNNIFIDINGVLNKRVNCIYSLEQCINHIQNREIHVIVDDLFIKNNIDNFDNHDNYMQLRKLKMNSYGYK